MRIVQQGSEKRQLLAARIRIEKTTILGGLLFPLPVVLVPSFLGATVGAVSEFVEPIAMNLHLGRLCDDS
jgi:uncharacterized membrane protein SpoIIM required for sporulation